MNCSSRRVNYNATLDFISTFRTTNLHFNAHIYRSPNKRMLETPDSNPHTATELAKKFRELYLKEWQDAYDEICKTFGPERTVRHLLWIVTVHI